MQIGLPSHYVSLDPKKRLVIIFNRLIFPKSV